MYRTLGFTVSKTGQKNIVVSPVVRALTIVNPKTGEAKNVVMPADAAAAFGPAGRPGVAVGRAFQQLVDVSNALNTPQGVVALPGVVSFEPMVAQPPNARGMTAAISQVSPDLAPAASVASPVPMLAPSGGAAPFAMPTGGTSIEPTEGSSAQNPAASPDASASPAWLIPAAIAAAIFLFMRRRSA